MFRRKEPPYHWIEATNLPIREYTMRTFDGTKIAYQVFGEGPIPVAICNGIGGTLLAWKHVLSEFRRDFRFISWDYRGLFNSEAPAKHDAYTIQDHAKDLRSVLEQEQVTEPVVLMGWSMGVQVALEYYHLFAETVRSIVLVNGTYGSVWDTAFAIPMGRHLFPLLLKGVKPLGPLIEVGLGVMVEQPVTMKLIKLSGLANKHLDETIFYGLAREFPKFNIARYLHMMEFLSHHSAEPYLHTVQVPTLIIHGEYDQMTPHKVTEVFLEKMPNAELFTVPTGSHYSIIEFPEIVNMRLERFFRPYLSNPRV